VALYTEALGNGHGSIDHIKGLAGHAQYRFSLLETVRQNQGEQKYFKCELYNIYGGLDDFNSCGQKITPGPTVCQESKLDLLVVV
jgi:hypothetical protein